MPGERGGQRASARTLTRDLTVAEGGSLGHPRIYINLDKPGPKACNYWSVQRSSILRARSDAWTPHSSLQWSPVRAGPRPPPLEDRGGGQRPRRAAREGRAAGRERVRDGGAAGGAEHAPASRRLCNTPGVFVIIFGDCVQGLHVWSGVAGVPPRPSAHACASLHRLGSESRCAHESTTGLWEAIQLLLSRRLQRRSTCAIAHSLQSQPTSLERKAAVGHANGYFYALHRFATPLARKRAKSSRSILVPPCSVPHNPSRSSRL